MGNQLVIQKLQITVLLGHLCIDTPIALIFATSLRHDTAS